MHQITLMPCPPKHPTNDAEREAKRIWDQTRKWLRRGMSEQDAFARASRVAGICEFCGATCDSPKAYTCRVHILAAAIKRNTAYRVAGRHKSERHCDVEGCSKTFKGAHGRKFCDDHYTRVKRVKVPKPKPVKVKAEKPTPALIASHAKKATREKQEIAVRTEVIIIPEGITVTKVQAFGWMAKGLRELIADELAAQ